MILNRCLLLTQHDKWLVRNSWKILQTHVTNFKFQLHSEKLLNVLFLTLSRRRPYQWTGFYMTRAFVMKGLNWKQFTGVMKRISLTWDCNGLSVIEVFCWFNNQKQPCRGALIKRSSVNMQQIYRRTPMPKYDFALRHRCSPVNLLNIFRTPFPMNTSRLLPLNKQVQNLKTVYQNVPRLCHSFGMYAKFSQKLTFLTPLIRTYMCVSRGQEILVFRKILCTY